MSAWLPDGNVLIALSDDRHAHHQPARQWFAASDWPFGTCPITQGTLLRTLMSTRAVADAASAAQVLTRLTAHRRHCFWPDDLAYAQVPLKGVLGHRQVTDAYLVALARKHDAKLATFDRGLAALHPDVALLIEA